MVFYLENGLFRPILGLGLQSPGQARAPGGGGEGRTCKSYRGDSTLKVLYSPKSRFPIIPKMESHSWRTLQVTPPP